MEHSGIAVWRSPSPPTPPGPSPLIAVKPQQNRAAGPVNICRAPLATAYIRSHLMGTELGMAPAG